LTVAVADQALSEQSAYKATECDFSAAKPTEPPDAGKKKERTVSQNPNSKSAVGSEHKQKPVTNTDNKNGNSQASAAAPCLGIQGYYDLKLAPTMLLVAAPACLLKSSKAIEIYRGKGSDTQFAILTLEEEKVVKPTVADAVLKIGDLNFKLTGTNLDLIDPKSISYKGTALSAQKADDGTYIIVTVDKSFPQQPGFYPISITLTDKKTKITGLVQVVRPPTTIVSQ